MKKIIQIASIVLGLTVLSFSPAIVVHAQSSGVIEVGEEDAPIPSTGAPTSTPAAPDTGIAPVENRFLQNAAVFIGGSLLGAGIGLSILNMRKKRLN